MHKEFPSYDVRSRVFPLYWDHNMPEEKEKAIANEEYEKGYVH